MEPTVSRSVEVAAGPGTVWSLVTDLPRMGEFSPENIGGRWVGGATGPAVGARFRGVNRNNRRRWSTRVKVIACEPERLFTFEVRSPFGPLVARWSYEITPAATGCRLTEHWYWAGSWLMRRFIGPRFTGRRDRPTFSAHSIEQTLAAVKARAEALRE